MKSLNIYHDFNLDLKLYSIPKKFIDSFQENKRKINFINIDDKTINKQDIEVFFGNRIKDDDIKSYKNIKWIHLGCVGYDALSIDYISRNNIILTNSKGLMTNSMIEQILNYITTFSRGTHRINNLRQSGKLTRQNFDFYYDYIENINTKKVLICGYGEVGKRLSEILNYLDMEVSLLSRTDKKDFKSFTLNNIDKAVENIDFIINLLPLSNETENIFNSQVFSKMTNAYFINVGRGKTVVEKDLIKAIEIGNLLGAALDVFEDERLELDNPLFNYKNIILRPHIAGLDSNYWTNQLDLFSHNLNKYLASNLSEMKNKIT